MRAKLGLLLWTGPVIFALGMFTHHCLSPQIEPGSQTTPQWTPKCQKCSTAFPESVKELQRRIGMPDYAVDGKLGPDTQGYYEAWYGNTLAMRGFDKAGGIRGGQ